MKKIKPLYLALIIIFVCLLLASLLFWLAIKKDQPKTDQSQKTEPPKTIKTIPQPLASLYYGYFLSANEKMISIIILQQKKNFSINNNTIITKTKNEIGVIPGTKTKTTASKPQTLTLADLSKIKIGQYLKIKIDLRTKDSAQPTLSEIEFIY